MPSSSPKVPDAIARRIERLAPARTPRFAEHLAILIPSAIGLVLLALASWGMGEIYEAVQEQDGLALLDRPVLFWMMSIRDGWLNDLVGGFTTIGGPVLAPVVAAVVVIALAISWRSWLPISLMAVATAGSVVVTVVGKQYFARVRPPHEFAVPPYEWTPSFPSGHSLNSVVIGGVVAYLLCRKVRSTRIRALIIALAALYALLMGLSRVYLGDHWLSDVITGWLVGGLWLGTVIAIHRVALALKRRRESGAPRGASSGRQGSGASLAAQHPGRRGPRRPARDEAPGTESERTSHGTA